MTLPTFAAEYDIIFVGGGASAGVAAGRLAAAAPKLRILLLEAGPLTKDMPEHVQPGRYITHLVPTTTTITHNVAKPSEYLGGRSAIVQSGRCVGGGSSVNFVLYNRPSASDFDDWATVYDNPGWSSKDMIPLLQKVETYEVDPSAPTHGSSGPLKVSYGGFFSDAGQQLLDIGPKYDKRRVLGKDGNACGVSSINTFARWPKWCSSDGKRSDVPHHFVYNQIGSTGLDLVHGGRVKRVLFDDKTATGVEFVFDNRVHPEAPQDLHTVRASKLVVVAAGAFGSPAILERSGIGSPDVLKAAGIPSFVNLPGVGTNYQDHLFGVVPYISDSDVQSYDLLFKGDVGEWTKELTQWATDGTGKLGANGVDAAVKVRPFDDELKEFGPEFLTRWKEFYANKPDKPVFWMSALAGFPTDQTGFPPLKFTCGGYHLAYPASRGSVHIVDNNVYTPQDFDAGFLNHPADTAALRWGYKKSREFMRRLPLFRGAFPPVAPAFAEDSSAALKDTTTVEISAPDIVYSAEDDKAIDDFHRKFIATTWHSLGTCAMKPRQDGGVVDSRLNVYGVKNLKVADISIPPSNVNSNTYSTALAIGEKAALIIAEELRITGV
ncbi:hypothetical protein EYR40_002943 [Pleurotus pulmonarius]|nr:hypothetical protein EYR40_002943 [Pleurotus pulmonarius]